MADIYAIVNPGFEDGATGWTLGPNVTVVTYSNPPDGTHVAQFTGNGVTLTAVNTPVPVVPGKRITASAMYQQGAASSGRNAGNVLLYWYDSAGEKISESAGSIVSSGSKGRWGQSFVSDAAPANAAKVAIAGRVVRTANDESYFDQFVWDHTFKGSAELTYPIAGTTYLEGTSIPFRVTVTPSGNVTPVKVEYFLGAVSLEATTTAPFAVNRTDIADGTYDVTAKVTFTDGTVITTNSVLLVVTDVPPPDPITREYNASNSYATLVASKFNGLASAIPSIAMVTGVAMSMTYRLQLLVRTRDRDVPADQANLSLPYDITNGATLETVLLHDNGGSYSRAGGTTATVIPIERIDFTGTGELGTSDGYRWQSITSAPLVAAIGGKDSFYGLEPISSPEFLDKAIGLRFYPNLTSVPAYTEAGDCVVRLLIDTVRTTVYFDAGSTEYFFASPDKTQVLSGELVSSYVTSGNLKNSDAAGDLQLAPVLTIKSGNTLTIGQDWTIHSAFPVNDVNMIGKVTSNEVNGYGMTYNSLPTQGDIVSAHSRYQFLTANFYGDPELESMYGANGVDRAFAYNGTNFYNIYTQPDITKDKPRHLAYHHAHLALGYNEGRVDVSVVGEPYSFDGTRGASSWAAGDNVVGLLSLSGTILGIFGSNTVTGLSGTTVDNFATQIISPKMGAIEYTITDMGYPVYANAYGIYTLAQVQQYGDYLGQPLSQDISPWIRPRLQRKFTSTKEVVAAWPVRAKNQYRLAFNDGYVLSMTMNNGQQGSPMFSTQKYFLEDLDPDAVVADNASMYKQEAIVPIAISSQLDETGEERIHVAHYDTTETVPLPPEEPMQYKLISTTSSNKENIYLDQISGKITVQVGSDCGMDSLIINNDLSSVTGALAISDFRKLTFVRGRIIMANSTADLKASDGGKYMNSDGYDKFARPIVQNEIHVSDLVENDKWTNYFRAESATAISNTLTYNDLAYQMVFTHPAVDGEVYAYGIFGLRS